MVRLDMNLFARTVDEVGLDRSIITCKSTKNVEFTLLPLDGNSNLQIRYKTVGSSQTSLRMISLNLLRGDASSAVKLHNGHEEASVEKNEGQAQTRPTRKWDDHWHGASRGNFFSSKVFNGSSTPPRYSPGGLTPQSYSPGTSRNAECSNCKHLLNKITVLEATVDMYMHPKQHTVNLAALFHEVYNNMGKLDLE
ncbi:hypothetical protein Tco_1533099 [Tanacetum coccineum]